jgi:hypothetical protein
MAMGTMTMMISAMEMETTIKMVADCSMIIYNNRYPGARGWELGMIKTKL